MSTYFLTIPNVPPGAQHGFWLHEQDDGSLMLFYDMDPGAPNPLNDPNCDPAVAAMIAAANKNTFTIEINLNPGIGRGNRMFGPLPAWTAEFERVSGEWDLAINCAWNIQALNDAMDCLRKNAKRMCLDDPQKNSFGDVDKIEEALIVGGFVHEISKMWDMASHNGGLRNLFENAKETGFGGTVEWPKGSMSSSEASNAAMEVKEVIDAYVQMRLGWGINDETSVMRKVYESNAAQIDNEGPYGGQGNGPDFPGPWEWGVQDHDPNPNDGFRPTNHFHFRLNIGVNRETGRLTFSP